MGGVICEACSPAGPQDQQHANYARLIVSGGVWDDANNPFEVAAATEATGTTGTTELTDPLFDGLLDGVADVGGRPVVGLPSRIQISDPLNRPPQRLKLTAQEEAEELKFALSVVFTDRESEAGWLPMPTLYVIDQLMSRIKKSGWKVAW